MTSTARLERDEVIAALTGSAVLARFAVKGRRCGAEFRTKVCPSCGLRSRDSVAINLASGRWIDHAHGCSGDVLDLVGGLAGIDPRRAFGDVLELAAAIAGVSPTTHDDEQRARLRADRERRERERTEMDAIEKAQRRANAIATSTPHWHSLARRSKRGEAYLEQRGVRFVLAMGLVRFVRGDVAMALRTADGQIVNVVRRRIDGGEPKVLGLPDCPTAGTFVNSIADISHGRDVVLVEGMFDALSARILFPRAVVLGAHGATNLPLIAAAAVKRIKLAQSRLILIPHDDDAGEKWNTVAGLIARETGLVPRHSLIVVDCDAQDLNDAHRAGWQWTETQP